MHQLHSPREFTHRVKSVSLGKFNRQEVEALQKVRAREIYLKDWDMQRMRLPDNSNVEKIRISSENLKNHEEDVRRASSYHSYSQSPPYDDQYEDRRYGKQASMLSRRPGSDRAIYEGRLRSFIFSPGRMRENMYKIGLPMRVLVQIFDFSLSSASDQFRVPQSSCTQLRDVLIEDQPKILNEHSDVVARRDLDGIQRPQRTASSGSFGSLESSTLSRKSVDSCSIVDVAAEPVQFTGNQHPVASPSPLSAQPHASLRSTNQVFNQPITQPSAAYSYPSLASAISLRLWLLLSRNRLQHHSQKSRMGYI
ncbi:putative ADP-ribosylation factor GTPase-activating protein AGD14 [Ananas comosus]|uniref:Putative ADP-ribosylation factor GTPase-activating protein AGD14 n=1 Tax=Ananas comosus TaxID=4615 RepID=A0A199VF23_ANACO|nr:putative ADP-ribosylation factor GTPase-activating protein AGD14 [Ananas comosus]